MRSSLSWYVLFIAGLAYSPRCLCIDSLYNEKDDLVSLSESNFDSTILATKNAWIVEFYNSWCGHCIRYAPFYKRLATSIKAWKPFLRIAAADCVQSYNTALCQSFEIKGVPTLKFFPAFSTSRNSSALFPALDQFDAFRKKLIDYISDPAVSNVSPRRLLILKPIRDISELLTSIVHKTQKAVVIFERESSYLGRQVILDTYGQTRLVVRRMLPHSDDTVAPSMFLVDPSDGNLLQTLASGDNSTEYVQILMDLIEPRARTTPDNEAATPIPQIDADTTTLPSKSSRFLAEDYLKVHEQDLESSLHYSLRREIAMIKTISGDMLDALKDYIQVLAKYLPVQQPIRLFVSQLNSWLQNRSGSVTGQDWLRAVNRFQTSGGTLPDSDVWTGCRGSESKYRGYPCSLWTTFHALTVSAYNQVLQKHDNSDDIDDLDVKAVLFAIRGYVKHFFGCRECSVNFMKGAVHIENKVTDARSAVLFLWKSHNRANHFLSGDVTEDPQHPKVEFPNVEQCPFCHASDSRDNSKTTFNEKEVLIFLQNMYSKENFVRDSPRLKTNDPDQWHEVKYLDSNQAMNFESRNLEHLKHSTAKTGFGSIDIGLCIAFYLLCVCFIAVIYLRFIRPRSLHMLGNACKVPV